MRSLVQAASILAGATLAVQAVVLGASLFQRRRRCRASEDPDSLQTPRTQHGGAWPGGGPPAAGPPPEGPALNPEGLVAVPAAGQPASSVVPYRPPLSAGRPRGGAGPGRPSPGPLSLQAPGADAAGAGAAGSRGPGNAARLSGNGSALPAPLRQGSGVSPNPMNGSSQIGAAGPPPGGGRRSSAAGTSPESSGQGMLAATPFAQHLLDT